MPAKSKKFTIEEGFTQIDEIMEKLSMDSTSLEDSFELYKEGMETLSKCKDIIDEVEKKVIILSEGKEETD